MVNVVATKKQATVRVLIIEDSSTICAMIDEVLSTDRRVEIVGYAATLETARRRISELRPDVVTLDLTLPDGSGFDLMEADILPNVMPKVVVVSASAGCGSDNARRAMRLGAAGVMDKAKLMQEGDRLRTLVHDAVHTNAKAKPIPNYGVRTASGVDPGMPPIPLDEHARLRLLDEMGLATMGRDPRFDGITDIVADMLEYPVVLLNVIGQTEQYVKSVGGSARLAIGRTSREVAFCSHTIASDEVLIVPDARRDPRFTANPLVVGDPGIRFYAGAPLIAGDGTRLGALCVVDFQPRTFNDARRRQLSKFSRLASALL